MKDADARRVTLGRIVGVFGVAGWVKVQSFTRPIDNLLDYRRWWIAAPEPYRSKVLEGRVHGNVLVAHLADAAGNAIGDRDVAARLLGTEVQVERAEMPPAPPGSYYWSDLIGLAVESTAGEPLGRVSGMLENGAQDVLVLDDGGVQRLIPFVHGPIIQSVDLAAGRIVADWAPDF